MVNEMLAPPSADSRTAHCIHHHQLLSHQLLTEGKDGVLLNDVLSRALSNQNLVPWSCVMAALANKCNPSGHTEEVPATRLKWQWNWTLSRPNSTERLNC